MGVRQLFTVPSSGCDVTGHCGSSNPDRRLKAALSLSTPHCPSLSPLPLDRFLRVSITSRWRASPWLVVPLPLSSPTCPIRVVCTTTRPHSSTGSEGVRKRNRASSALEYCVTFPMTSYRRCQKGVNTNLYDGRKYGLLLSRAAYLTITVFWCSHSLLPWRWL